MDPFSEYFIEHTPTYNYILQLERTNMLLRKQLKKSFKDKLPPLKHDYIILPDKRRANSGDKLTRPIVKNIRFGDAEHYGFVYGTSENGDCIIIEMNTSDNVAAVTFGKFLTYHDARTIEIIPKPKETTLPEILMRAEEWEFENYSYYSKNCQQFVNYSVFGIRYSPAIDNLNVVSTSIIDLRIAFLNYQKAFTTQPEYRKFIEETVNRLTNLKGKLQANIKSDNLELNASR